MTGAEGQGGPPGPAARPRPPVPLVLSCAAGAVGLVLLVAGAATSEQALSVAGVAAGTGSLGAALYWRSLLITAWAQRRVRPGPGGPPTRPGGAGPGRG